MLRVPRVASLLQALLLLAPVPLLVVAIVSPSGVPVYTGPTGFNGQRAYELLRLIISYRNRTVGSDSNLRLAKWIEGYFSSLGLETHVQRFEAPNFSREKVRTYNVYAVKRGSSNMCVVIVAHRDIVPTTEEGANDNGSGLAILLELARVLSERPLNISIVFLVTDAEETGLHGARYFVGHFEGRDRILAALSVDMCGWAGGWGTMAYAYSSGFEFSDAWILLVLRELGVVVSPALDLVQRIGGSFMGTDSMPFVAEGIPAAGLCDVPVYPYWHTVDDTVDKVSPQKLERVGSIVERFVMTVNNYGSYRLGAKFLIVDGLFLGYYRLLILQALAVALPLVALLESLADGANMKEGLKVLARLLASSLITSVVYVILLLAGLLILRRNAPLVHLPGTIVISALTTYGLMRGVKYEWRDLKASAASSLIISGLLGFLNPPVSVILLLPMAYSLFLARPSSKLTAYPLCAFQFLSPILLCVHALTVGGVLGLLMVSMAPLAGVSHSIITSPLIALAGLAATLLTLSCAEAVFYIVLYESEGASGGAGTPA